MAKVAEQARLARTNHVTLAQPQSKACASSQGQVKGVQHQKILIRRFSPAFVDRKADVFIVSRTSWQTASILHVLSLRQAEVRQRPAPSQGQDEEAVILDKGARSRVEKILYQEYLQEPETQTLSPEVWQRAVRLAAERRAKGERASAKDLYERSMRSYWKTTVFNRYGGEIWLLTLIATGRVHPVSVQIVNDVFAERIREDAEREPTSEEAGEEDPQNYPAP